MNKKSARLFLSKRIFAWLALACGLLLLIPLLLQFTIGTGVDGQGFNWRLGDFIVMWVLLFAVGAGTIVLATRVARQHWWLIGIASVLILFYVWAELAVGIFMPFGT